MDIRVLDDNPIYKDQVYRLQFSFSNSYPIGTSSLPLRSSPAALQTLPLTPPTEAPEVVFISDSEHPIPMHPHVYSNGIICLDLLDKAAWSPVHNVESVCISLQSMLTGNSKNERPPGDEDFVRRNTRRPRDINWSFHDNDV
jgi:ubiquitin-conjugating enzyme E2 W